MDSPQYQQPALDPDFEAVKARAEQDKITAIQASLSQDTASLLARYGKMQAISASTAGSPSGAMPLMGMAALTAKSA